MLGLTPDPLSAGVGMHVAIAGPYTATNGSPRGRTVQTRNGRIPPGGPFRLAEHARRTAPSPACRKRRHMLIGYARVSKATAPSRWTCSTMLIGYAGVSKADGSQSLDRRAATASVATSSTWSTPCRTCRPAAWACGCSPGKARRSTPPQRPAASCSASSRRWPSSSGRRERTLAGLTAARARGRKGGRTFALSKAQVRLAQAAMAHRDTSVSALCRELGITPVTLYRYVGPQGQLREQGEKVLAT